MARTIRATGAALLLTPMVWAGPPPASGAPTPGGNITVTIFQDFNANGVRDLAGSVARPAIDAGVNGATVTATCLTDNGPDGADGTGDGETHSAPIVATASGDGTYAFNALAGSPCRIEVTALPVGFQAGPLGIDNGGLVQFADAGTSALVGLVRPLEFCQDNPLLATSCMAAGNATPAVMNARGVEVFMPPTTFGSTTTIHPSTPIANIATVGTTYGIAYERASGRIFASAFVRRKAALGSLGLGGIYVTTPTSAPTAAQPFVDLNALYPGSAGTDPRPAVKPAGYWLNDEATVPAVGKIGIGDIELSADGSMLYAVALGNRTLYAIPTTGTLSTATVIGYPIPTTMANCVGSVRPFALGLSPVNDLIHVGAVCSGQPGGTAATLRAYVWAFDGATFTNVLDQPLVRSQNLASLLWRPWDDTDQSLALTWNPQPMLTDITFQGPDMVLGIRDRYGDQTPGNGVTTKSAPWPRGGGDIIRACRNGAIFDLEHPTLPYCGRAGGETYVQDDSGDTSPESSLGSVLQIPGWSGIYDTAYDAVAYTSAGPVDNHFDTGGVQLHNNTTRQQTANADLYTGDVEFFGKASGMGDLVALCDQAPVEIGNRVWLDADGNGQQDPGETPLAGVPVTLTVGSASFEVLTDANGNYVFSSDNRLTGDRPSLASGEYAIGALAKGASVVVSVPPTITANGAAHALTPQNVVDDRVDSDADPVSGTTSAFVIGAPGHNDHTYDFGYTKATPPPPPPDVYDLALIKTLPTGQRAIVGSRVRFDITVANQGDGPSGEFTVTDTLPSGTEFVSATEGGVGSKTSRTITWTIADLAAGDTVTVSVVVKIASFAPSYRNWAEISSDSGTDEDSTPDTTTGIDRTAPNDQVVNHNDIAKDTVPGDEDDNDFEEIVGESVYDLALIKTLAPKQRAVLGGTVTFNVTVANQGNVASGRFTVVDAIPTGMAFVSATDGGVLAPNARSVTWTVAQLAPGARKSFTLALKVTGRQARYRNWAEIASDSGNDEDSAPDTTTGRDGTAPNDRVVNHNDISKDVVTGDEDDNDFEDIADSTVYDLALIKTIPAGQRSTVGSVVTFTVTVKNQGNVASGRFTVTDTLPSGTAFVSASPKAAVADRTATWTVANLAPGASKTFTIRVRLMDAALRYRNWAEISTDSGIDEDSTPDRDTGDNGTPPNDSVVNHNDISKDTVPGDEDDNDFEEIVPTLDTPQTA